MIGIGGTAGGTAAAVLTTCPPRLPPPPTVVETLALAGADTGICAGDGDIVANWGLVGLTMDRLEGGRGCGTGAVGNCGLKASVTVIGWLTTTGIGTVPLTYTLNGEGLTYF
jgi:hypothetical protein